MTLRAHRYLAYSVASAIILVISSSLVVAQPDAHAQEVAPPPLKLISKADREQLNNEKDAKDRVKLTLSLAETYLAGTETKTTEHDYDGAAAAAGKYWALIEDIFVFMKTLKQESNKARDLYKRIELTLRAHGPRLATIRRSTPVAHAVWIKAIEDYARSGRTEALNSFYGHTVVHERPQKPAANKSEKPAP